MNLTTCSAIAIGLALSAGLASADVTYTCAPGISSATCVYLNTTVAGYYNNTFTNVTANIYIQYGTTALGQGENPSNSISYSTYLSDYAANAATSGNPNQATALTSLNNYATPVYAGTDVMISGALGQALGISANDLLGFDAFGNSCTLSAPGCYEDLITITNDPGTLLYYRNGPIDPTAYDFYSLVEHETDEALGTVSCIETQDPTLMNNCSGGESAADLFRYQSPGQLIADSSLSTTPGAYLSYDGGATNGLGSGVYYNTLSNGDDYGDFLGDLGCPTAPYVQDGEGCAGFANLNITNDGGAEIAMLNTVGFDLQSTPEPGSVVLCAVGLVGLISVRRRRAA